MIRFGVYRSGNYKHLIESNVADLQVLANTFGGAITAALFLENFIEGDIPGPIST